MSLIKCKENVNLTNRLVKTLEEDETLNSTLSDFRCESSNSGKINFVYDILKRYDSLPKYIEDRKYNERSSRLRKKGNRQFVSDKDEEALETYTYSVAIAESRSQTLGLAYGSRSAVLFKLKLFDECLEDITRALENNYPEDQRMKLIERRRNAEQLRLRRRKLVYHQPLPTIPGENKNPLIECSSNVVKIRSDPKYGRCVIATRDIEMGEVIAVEQATFTLLTDRKWCHCHHCLTLCYCLVPCESCTQALFCSIECKYKAKKYHDFECPILATLNSLELNSRVLPLRIAILQKKEYNNLEEKMSKPDPVYKSGRYKEIHNLVTNLKFRLPSNLFDKTVHSAIFYHLMKNYTDFFKNADFACEETFKNIVLHNSMVMSCNFHNIQELGLTSNNEEYELKSVGAGAFNFLSLFNHSCAANVYRINYGTTYILIAIESIKRGDQLFESYRFDYVMYDKTDRRAVLKKEYFFDCDCRACTNNWGTIRTLPQINAGMDYKRIANFSVRTIAEIETEARNVAKAFEKKIPCKDFYAVQEIMKQCHTLCGNFRMDLKCD